jgi:hydrogenase nickel incorporation protein HypA/HybF
MHELSIAMGIVEIACEESQRRGDARVESVYLRLGPLSGVVKDSLLFAWEMACSETPVAGSQLVIEEVPVELHCSACGAEHRVEGLMDRSCPACGSFATEVLRGAELEVTAMEITDTRLPDTEPRP